MVKRTRLFLTGLSALAFGTLGCTPLPLKQPELPPETRASKWAEDYDGNISRNSNDLGKSLPVVTDDKVADSARRAQSPAPTDPVPTKRFVPLKYEDRIPSPTPYVPPKPGMKVDPEVQQAALFSKDDKSDKPEEQKSVLPTPMLNGGITVSQAPIAKPKEAAQPSATEVKPMPPFIRQEPTATGEIIGLGPNESPLDRALELARRLVAVEAENKMMFHRMKKLDAELEAKEKFLTDSANEVEQANAEVAKVRSDLQQLRKDAVALKKRLRDVEIEDLETMRSIIAALEKLLAPEPKKLKEPKE